MEKTLQAFAPIEGWYPLEAQIEITYDCCLRCPMCYNGVRANEKKFDQYIKEYKTLKMDKNKKHKLHEIVEKCLRNGTKFFTITGGEPLLYSQETLSLIRLIKTYGCYASINSNAVLIDEVTAMALRHAGLNSALISVHGPDEKTHKKTVCVENAFERTINGVKNLLKNNIHVVPNFVASHINVDKMEETAIVLYNLGIKKQAYSIFIPTPGVDEHERLKMTDEDYKTYFLTIDKLNKKYNDLTATATLPVPPCLSKGIVSPENMGTFEHRTCPSGRQFMVVNENGNTSPCIQLAWNEKYGANIFDENNAEKLSMWKNLFNTPNKCVECGFKGYCNPCNMNILRENNDIMKASSIPYPTHENLTNEEAIPFKKKFEIEVSVTEAELKKTYKLRDNVLFRREKEGYLTIINPNIQGYTVVKGVIETAFKGAIRFDNIENYKLLKAMNLLVEVNKCDTSVQTIKFSLVPKYKILTEFIGCDFNDKQAVYCLRTDTAGRFFCMGNTKEERKAYSDAKEVYLQYLK